MTQRLVLPLFSVFALIGGTVPASAADEPVVLTPSTPWALDYGDARCRLTRVFGEGDARTVLFLEQHEPSRSLEWVLAGDALSDMSRTIKLNMQYGPGQPEVAVSLGRDTLGKLGRAIRGNSLTHGVPLDEVDEQDEGRQRAVGLMQLDPAEGEQIEYLSLSQGKRKIMLQFGPLGAAYEAMNACMADLVRHWGADLERERQRAFAPVWKNGKAVAGQISRDYPGNALRRGQQADLHMRIMIDETGKPSKCLLTDLTIADDFGDGPCKMVMKSAEFEPALDLNGKPMPSFYVTRIVYRVGG